MASMYPAIEASMGRWTYYIVKIKFGDLAKEVKLSTDVHQDRTLDETIQRIIQDSRARQDLVVYLQDREDRFLNSIVVAALGGSPTFTPLRLEDTPENRIFQAMQVDRSFGVLTFAGGQKYYALDGQHRLAAVKAILEPTDANRDQFAREYITEKFRQEFRDEEISVIMVVQDPEEDESARDEMLKDYRRLFSSLNRYAKPTDQVTNIIMDEDDGIAILTRRLISEHEFFKWTVEKPSEYSIVKTTKGKNLKSNDSYFTQLEVLYEMNLTFLTSASRSAKGWRWRPSEREFIAHRDFKKIWRINRPDEEVIDEYYEELSSIWDALLKTLPELREPPPQMRVHNPNSEGESDDVQDHALFWPIGQVVLAKIVRQLLDRFCVERSVDILEGDQVNCALGPLNQIEWSLHSPPWRNLLLVQSSRQSWTMRNEERTVAIKMAAEIIEFIVGVNPLDQQSQDNLRQRWSDLLVPTLGESEENAMWESILSQAIGEH